MFRVAINGFGRIGRMILRSLLENQKNNNIQVVAINDPMPLDTLVHLFKYDSTHGRFKGDILKNKSSVNFGLGSVEVFSETDLIKLPWHDMKIDLVMECSGRFKNNRQSLKHVEAGAKKVLISTIIDDADITIVYGVNHHKINKHHKLISNASCTSNCLLTVLHPIHNSIKIDHGHMMSVHSYTNDQCLVDSFHSDLHRTRAIASSMIPSTTNAAKAINLIIPELENKIHCTAVRVPTQNVSMIDFNFVTSLNTTEQELNKIIKQAAGGYLKNILGHIDEPLVSIDFNHDPKSAVVDISQTKVTSGNLCKVVAWYDNEWAFANRMCDVANYLSQVF